MNAIAPPVIAQRSTMNGKPVFTVPSQSVVNFDSGFRHKLLCDGLTFTTGSACTFSCSFCYVPDMTRKYRPWLDAQGVRGAHEDIVIRREDPISVLRKQLATTKGRALARKQLVIYASPLVDVASNLDLVRETVEACKVILAETKWQIRLLSKSHLLPQVADRLCFDLPASTVQQRLIFGVSTGTLDDRLASTFEAGAPLVSKRLASIHWLQDHGFRTFGMVCPSLPQRDYDKFAGDMAAAIRSDQCEHIWAEVINLRGDSFTRTVNALRKGGLDAEAAALETVSTDKMAWERYARATFEAHALIYRRQRGPDRKPKLRFLQYATKSTLDYWGEAEPKGAVLL